MREYSVYFLNSVDTIGRYHKTVICNLWKPSSIFPGKRNGEPVRFRMRVPITFPGGAKP